MKRWRTSVPPAQLPIRSLVCVRSDFFALGFDNPGFREPGEEPQDGRVHQGRD